jgi:hypothetical protein
MKIILWLVVLLALLPAPLPAATEAQKVLSEEFISLTNIREYTEELLEQVRTLQMKELEQLKLHREQSGRAKELQLRTFDLLHAELTWEKMKPAYVDLYAATFSEEELTAMILFYGSPAGRNLVVKMPFLARRSTELIETRMQELLPRLRQLMLELVVNSR